MSSWAAAHRLAHMRAVRARDELEVPPGHPVDVYSAIAATGTTIMWRAMPRLLGAYFDDPESDRGVLLNPDLSSAGRRHTAAHELGHDRFGHGTRLDRDDDDHLGSPLAGWPPVEREAEAFAAWFLMPPSLIRAAMAGLGLSTITSPDQVYQLALRLGTPYRTTARHLGHARIVPVSRTTAWLRASPTRIKAALDRIAPKPTSRNHDVWRIDDHAAGDHLVVAPGDRLSIVGAHDIRHGIPPGLIELARGPTANGSPSIVLEAPPAAGHPVQTIDVDAPRPWQFSIEVRPPPSPGWDPLTWD